MSVTLTIVSLYHLFKIFLQKIKIEDVAHDKML